MTAPISKKKKRSTTAKNTANVQAPPHIETVPPVALPRRSGNRLRVVLALLTLGLIWHLAKGNDTKQAPGSAPAPAPAKAAEIQPDWGKELRAEKVASWKAPAGTMDLHIRANGDVIALTGDSLSLFVSGKLSRTASIGAGPNRSLTGNDKALFVTNSDNATIQSFGMNLAFINEIKVKDAGRLLGLAWSESKQAMVVAAVSGQPIYTVAVNGRIIDKKPAGKIKIDEPSFVYDIAPGPGAGMIVTDIYKGTISMGEPGSKAPKVLKELCSSNLNRRLAYLKGRLYVPCQAAGAVLVVGGDGKVEGYLKAEDASMARTGQDGFLYVLADGKITKFKPL